MESARIILGVTKWTVVRFSNGLCFRVSHRANRLETNTKYEHPRQEESEPRLFGPASPSTLGREKKDFFDGEIRHNPATRDSSQGTSARPEPPSHPASAYRLSGGPRREAARPRRDTHGDEVLVAFHLRHSCVRRPRKLLRDERSRWGSRAGARRLARPERPELRVADERPDVGDGAGDTRAAGCADASDAADGDAAGGDAGRSAWVA